MFRKFLPYIFYSLAHYLYIIDTYKGNMAAAYINKKQQHKTSINRGERAVFISGFFIFYEIGRKPEREKGARGKRGRWLSL